MTGAGLQAISWRRLWSVALGWLLAASLVPGRVGADEGLGGVVPFLQTYCHECHGPDRQEDNLRLDTLPRDLADAGLIETWQQVLDQVRAGNMPPSSRPRPAAEVRERAIERLERSLADAYARSAGSAPRPVIRRLNRIELRNTLRDLLFLEQPMFWKLGLPRPEDANGDGSVSRHSDDPIAEFPADELEHGFDNVGSRLVMSDFLLRLVIEAAEKSLAFGTVPGPQPPVGDLRFAGHIRTEGPGGLEGWSRKFHPEYDVLLERYREPGAATNIGRIAPSAIAGKGVGVSGRWRIRVVASAHHRTHPWGELIHSRDDEPFLLGLHLIDTARGAFNEGNPNTELLVQWPLPDDGEPHEYVHETWIDARWVPWLGWENAPYERSLQIEKLVERYRPDQYRPRPRDNATEADRQQYQHDMAAAIFRPGYAGPHIRIHSLAIEPVFESWPPRSHTFLYGVTGTEPLADLVRQFASRAWRRPVEVGEVTRSLALAQQRLDAGGGRDEALRTAYVALLASPQFYYVRDLPAFPQYERASRLSYFLWSSMPDAALFDRAARGELATVEQRHAEVERMLNDRRARSLVRRFTERWLRLDKLGSMPPPGGFYFHRQMEEQMRQQVDAYMGDLIARNGPLREIIDSDHTFLNERTAQWIYQRSDVWGDAFRRVPARAPHGGGLLTMPAMMTATANGVDTSPIMRGVWVLESVLGTPPPPPPPNVEPLSPDLRGARTIRQQLEAHRAQESCRSCHEKIDPLGFAFENFDELGLWRTHYRTGDRALPIDTASTLADGRTVADIAGLKLLLLEREEQIARNVVGKMLTYATGRVLTAGDRGEIERIVNALRPHGYRLRDLIHLVAESPLLVAPAANGG